MEEYSMTVPLGGASVGLGSAVSADVSAAADAAGSVASDSVATGSALHDAKIRHKGSRSSIAMSRLPCFITDTLLYFDLGFWDMGLWSLPVRYSSMCVTVVRMCPGCCKRMCRQLCAIFFFPHPL